MHSYTSKNMHLEKPREKSREIIELWINVIGKYGKRKCHRVLFKLALNKCSRQVFHSINASFLIKICAIP